MVHITHSLITVAANFSACYFTTESTVANVILTFSIAVIKLKMVGLQISFR